MDDAVLSGHPAPVAVVTGGAAGLGFAVAQRLIGEGYAVALYDRDADGVQAAASQLQAAGGTAVGFSGSVTDDVAVAAAFEQVVDRLGGFDVLVNNAGVSAHAPSLDLTAEAWRTALDVNLTGVFLCAQAAGRIMVGRGGGSIVNVASMYGIAAAPERAAYCSSKAGVVMLTKVLAVEWAAQGIRVNGIAPGYVRTSLLEELIADGRVDADALRRRIPLGRFGTPDEVAHVIAFLASPETGWLTGQIVGLDGGWTANGYL